MLHDLHFKMLTSLYDPKFRVAMFNRSNVQKGTTSQSQSMLYSSSLHACIQEGTTHRVKETCTRRICTTTYMPGSKYTQNLSFVITKHLKLVSVQQNFPTARGRTPKFVG